MNAPIPANEKRRLEVLWQYEVLDTPPDETLDDLTELAAHIGHRLLEELERRLGRSPQPIQVEVEECCGSWAVCEVHG